MEKNNIFEALLEQLNHVNEAYNQPKKLLKKQYAFLQSIMSLEEVYINTLTHSQDVYTKNNIENIRNQYLENERITKNILQEDEAYKSFVSQLIQTRELYTKKISKSFHQKVRDFDAHINNLKSELDPVLKTIIRDFNRARSTIIKQIDKVKETYEDETKTISSFKKERLSQQSDSYEQKLSSFEQHYKDYLDQQSIILQQIIKDKQKQVAYNDANYVIIKKTHHTQHDYINQTINKRKKELLLVKETLTKEHDKVLAQLEEHYQLLKTDNQKKVFQEHDRYAQKLNALNVVFDVQKSDFSQNKKRLSKKNADAVTLLNSKLASSRDQIIIEKSNLKKQFFSNLKNADDDHKKVLEHAYTQALKALDLSLEKQIKRTNKDVLAYHKKYQKDLLSIETKHVEQINNWRVSRTLYEQEHKLFIQSLDKQLNLISKSEQHDIELQKSIHKLKNSILDIQISIDLLPLETQAHLSSAVQEREINLLSNETQIFLQEKNLYEFIIKTQIDIEANQKDFLINSLKSENDYLTKKITIESQNNQELAKIKKDTLLSIQNQKLNIEEISVKRGEKLNNYHQKLYDATLTFLRDQHKLIGTKQIESLRYNLNQLSLKYRQKLTFDKQMEQAKKNILKIESTMTSFKLELDKNEINVYAFFDNVFKYYQVHLDLNESLVQLFKLPATPEHIKDVSLLFIEFILKYKQNISGLIFHYEGHIRALLDDKINDYAGYKYMLKHETIISEFNESNNILVTELDQLNKKIDKYRYQLSNLENNLIKLNNLIQKHSSLRKTDVKENYAHHTKAIKNYRHGIKSAKAQLLKNDKDIATTHTNISAIKLKIDLINREKMERESKIDSEKQAELKDFYLFKSNIQALTKKMNKILDSFVLEQVKHFENFTSTSGHYLTEEKFDIYMNSYEKNAHKYLNKYQQMYQKYLQYVVFLYKHFNDQQVLIKQNVSETSTHIGQKIEAGFNLEAHTQMIAFETKKKEISSQIEQLTVDYENLKVNLFKDFEFNRKEHNQRLINFEAHIYELNETFKNQQDLMRINLQDVLTNIESKFSSDLKKLKLENESKAVKLKRLILNNQKSFEETKSSNQMKHKALLDRYQTIHKNLMSNKNKRILDLENQMKKLRDQHEKQTNQKQLILLGIEKEYQLFVHDHPYRLKFFEKQYKHQQKPILKREIKALKKSYLFKIKELKLK